MAGYRSSPPRPSGASLLSHTLHQLHLTSPLPYVLLAAAVLLLLILLTLFSPSHLASPFITLSSPPSMTDPLFPPSPLLAINICLLPPPLHSIYQRAHALQPLLQSLYPSSYVFSSTRFAHVTVVQAYIERSSLPSLLTALTAQLHSHPNPPHTPLTLRMRRELVPGGPSEGLYVPSIAIDLTPALSSLHQRVMEAVRPFRVSDASSPLMSEGAKRGAFYREDGEAPVCATIVEYVGHFEERSAGERYYPHVSLGLLDEAHVGELGRVEREQLQRTATTDGGDAFEQPWTVERLSIFQLGDWGTVRRQLHEVEL